MDKYQKALERAKKGLPIDEVFPELKESEDERIRKELIDLFRDCINNRNHPYNASDSERWIAYLEKQKEQKHEDWPNLSNCIHDCKKCQGKCFYRKEMYQEQDNVNESDDDKLYVADILSLLNFGCSTHSRNEIDMWIKSLPERLNLKPAEWSEEDKKRLDAVISIVEDWEKSLSRKEKEYYGERPHSNWLKSLRPQSKQEWTGATVEQVETIATHLDNLGNTAMSEILRSIHPQPHWKPSEEQMSALVYFIRSWGESGTMSPQNPTLCAAKSLYNDLKKQM